MHFDGLSFVTGFIIGWLAGISIFIITGFLRMNSDTPQPPTPWETSAFDPDVEIRWNAGSIESRLKPPVDH